MHTSHKPNEQGESNQSHKLYKSHRLCAPNMAHRLCAPRVAHKLLSIFVSVALICAFTPTFASGVETNIRANGEQSAASLDSMQAKVSDDAEATTSDDAETTTSDDAVTNDAQDIVITPSTVSEAYLDYQDERASIIESAESASLAGDTDITGDEASEDAGDTDTTTSSTDITAQSSTSTTTLTTGPVDLSYLADSYSKAAETGELGSMQTLSDATLPSSYDLRDTGRISYVRDQSVTQNCWAFATLAAAESTATQYYPGLQLSCAHLAWFTYNGNEEEEASGTLSYPQQVYTMPSTYQEPLASLAAWKGPLTEDKAPFLTQAITEEARYEADAHLTSALYLPASGNTIWEDDALQPSVGSVKQLIYDEGAVVMFFASGASSTNYTYPYEEGRSYTTIYNSIDPGTDHAVAIVGWDDSFSRNNFGGDTSALPKNDGAWLVKNSWGNTWGDEGYFWVSYEDKSIVYAGTVGLESADNFDHNYQYDTLGWTTSLSVTKDGTTKPDARSTSSGASAYMANIFSATGAQTLDAISFYTTDVNTSYTISVYLDPEDGKPTSGKKIGTSQSGSEPYPGYHTVRLNDDLKTKLSSGQKFSIVVKLTNPFFTNPIAAEATIGKYAKSDMTYVGKDADGNTEVSYVSPDGSTWTTLGRMLYDGYSAVYATNVCLKAFTQDADTSGSAWPDEASTTARLNGIVLSKSTTSSYSYGETSSTYTSTTTETLDMGDPTANTPTTNFDVIMGYESVYGTPNYDYGISIKPVTNWQVSASVDGGETFTLTPNEYSSSISLGSLANTSHTITLCCSDPAGVRASTTYTLHLYAGYVSISSYNSKIYTTSDVRVVAPDGSELHDGDSVAPWSATDGETPNYLKVYRGDTFLYSVKVPLSMLDPTDKDYKVDYYNEQLLANNLTGTIAITKSDGSTQTDSSVKITPGETVTLRLSNALKGFLPPKNSLTITLPERQSAPSVTAAKTSSTSITLDDTSGRTDAQYRIAGTERWYNSGEFKNLTPDTEYTFEVRYPASAIDKQFASEVSTFTAKTSAETVDEKVVRLSGESRYDTMQQVVDAGFSETGTVILATGENYPDALAASALAGAENAPLLLTESISLSAQAKSSIETLGARRVIILGGEAAICASVEESLRSSGLDITRIYDDTRQGTALQIYKELQMQEASFDTVIVASGNTPWDALSVSPYAYKNTLPVVLTETDGTLSADAYDLIKSSTGVKNVVIVGGSAVVSESVEHTLAEYGLNVERWWGQTRYETSASIAQKTLDCGMSISTCAIATGENFPDALAGGALVGAKGGVMLLASDNNTQAIDTLLTKERSGLVKRCYLLGGENAVSTKLAAYTKSLLV